ncbi:MAG: HDOD domain-containing protein [Gammaproteobacteria bacterium]|nr:HDOD domain-containing protein [Gammaproteobacteria bacterium]
MPDNLVANDTRLRINKLQELPPLPVASQRLLAILSSEDAGMGEVAEAIELDPALAARIVGVARSAFFGNTTTIYGVKDAIIRVLGLDMVRSLGLSISLGDALSYEQTRGFDARRYWISALLTADMARFLAPRVALDHQPQAEPAYLSGLLHGLGLLALAHLFPNELSLALEAAGDDPVRRLAEHERQWVGIDHHAAGGWLARRWHLPEEVARTMEHHHDPHYRGPFWPTVLLVGNCARWSEWRQAEEPGLPPSIPEELHTLGIPVTDMAAISAAFERKYEQTLNMAAALAGES